MSKYTPHQGAREIERRRQQSVRIALRRLGKAVSECAQLQFLTEETYSGTQWEKTKYIASIS